MAKTKSKTNFTVVRNEGFMRSSFETRYRHNERQNETYGNGDIDQNREHLNIHFWQNLREDGSQETYGETFDRLLSSGAISEKWLKPDSKLVDELVFDVNTDYFEQRGGYDYAVQFFTEAYRLAVKEVGNEEPTFRRNLCVIRNNINRIPSLSYYSILRSEIQAESETFHG
ncbi:MAG: plasmid recombination protein [Oscillospiraceae bacterium]|jgi:hypothetical protein|nr:plasmid recombination protein [Oscillospiraceae bacterium]